MNQTELIGITEIASITATIAGTITVILILKYSEWKLKRKLRHEQSKQT